MKGTKTMKTVFVAAVATSLLLSSQVFAQSKNFEGFAAEFSTGSQKNSLSNGPILLNANNN